MRTLLAFILVLLLASPAGAAMKVVSAAHPDTLVPDLPGYTVALPSGYATIVAGLQASAASDTVYVRPGTYDEQISYANWASSDVMLIGSQNLTSEIRYTNSGTSFVLFAPDTDESGCTVKWMRLDGDGNTGSLYAFMLSTAQDYTISECVTEGNFSALLLHGIGFVSGVTDGCATATVDACSLSFDHAASGASDGGVMYLNVGGSITPADDLTISNCTIACADGNVSISAMKTIGATGLTISNCTIWLPASNTSAGRGIDIRSDLSEGEISSDISIIDCEIFGQAYGGDCVSYETIAIGANRGADGIVDDVTVARCDIRAPMLETYWGIKVEANYDEIAGRSATHSDNIKIYDNRIQSGNLGIGFLENARFCVATRNLCIGPGKGQAWNSYGMAFEDARKCTFSNNIFRGWKYGARIGHTDGIDAPDFRNSANVIDSNQFENCDYAVWLLPYEGAGEDAPVDSLMQSRGNLAKNCTTFGYITDGATPTGAITIAEWAALTIADLSGWEHAVGDIEFSDYAGDLKRVRGFATGTYRIFGDSLVP